MLSKGSAPSQAEICEHFRYKSPNAARQNLKLIEKKGYIELFPVVARGIRLLKSRQSHSDHKVPLLGMIAAGRPILAEENVEERIALPKELFPKPNGLFALRVAGDSMIGAGILNGDIAIIRKQKTIHKGALAVVRIESEATLKRVLFGENSIILRAENPAYTDVEIQEVSGIKPQIEGVLEGVIRTISQYSLRE